jgi:hypothetical protein
MERFWNKVNKTETCWLWTGGKNQKGYGLWKREYKGKNHSVHRLSYELHKGPIPEGMLICHTCDVPSCLNPDHLFVGTALDNAQDRDRKKRRNVVGERIGTHKLTEEQVLQIRKRFTSRNSAQLAKEFGVSRTCIYLIVSRIRWNHI